MKHFYAILLLLLSAGAATAQHQHSSGDATPASLMADLGNHHHPVSTRNREAQRFFDQGITFVYAFNHDEAARSFKRAAELDPRLAMAHWGIALAVGPNYNLDVDPDREKAAYDAIQKALSLAPGASEKERAYIEALAKRYSNDPRADLKKLAVDYKGAMGELARRFPDDLDAATLYADSLMVLKPWQLWGADGKPAEGTEEIIRVLESVLKRDPNHVGANHLYIHAVEASPRPERALQSAERLRTLVPAAGHLVHMPAHIFMRTGDYSSAARSNAIAAEVDRAYIKKTNAQGVYPLMYYSHNLHFLAIASSMAGRFEDAIKAADQLNAYFTPFVKQMQMLDTFLPTPTLVLVRFRRWGDVLKLPEPDRTTPATNAIWHFGRGMAFAATGRIEQAESEQKTFADSAKALPPDAVWGLSKMDNVMKIANGMLGARIALAKGDKKSAIELLRQAAEVEDALAYNEPPDWVLPVRESLGGALLLSGDYPEAEKVFRADLKRNPLSGRSLFGLLESLNRQGKKDAAASVQKEFKAAWKNADTRLRIEDL
ncbi:MAG TPA: tetratricopeptide repeat protein [Blastocatellia bacterium]|jgi:tetratricopeptide (TPR) repeat protein|nr:tetratricopeptide repeat protein [Blastocatellia bacterium]